MLLEITQNTQGFGWNYAALAISSTPAACSNTALAR
jgi:hypothetical protein